MTARSRVENAIDHAVVMARGGRCQLDIFLRRESTTRQRASGVPLETAVASCVRRQIDIGGDDSSNDLYGRFSRRPESALFDEVSLTLSKIAVPPQRSLVLIVQTCERNWFELA